MSIHRGRLNIPAELDVLDSPLSAAPGPFSALTGIPGSALAERIFNDPDSWEDTDGDEGDYPEDVEDDALIWLTEEIDKIRVNSASTGAFQLPVDKRDSKDTGLHRAPIIIGEGPADWRGIAQRGGVRPISLAGLFEQSNEEFSDDIQHQLSKILDSGGIKHHIGPRPVSATLSPPLTGLSSATTESLPSASSTASSALGEGSPAPVQSASALSFLEYYGIYPDSPLTDVRKSFQPRKKSIRHRPMLQVPSPLPNRSSLGITPSTASTTKHIAVKRFSNVSPPGLGPELRPMTPPGLDRQSSHPQNQEDSSPTGSDSEEQVIEVALSPQTSASPRSRPLPTTAPPPYPRTPSPSKSLLAASTPIRRLPTIPPETAPSPSPPRLTTRHTTHPPAQSAGMISPPANTSTTQAFLPLSAAFAAGSSTPFTPYPPPSSGLQTPQVSSSRPQSTVRSPLGVPVGPRIRGRTPSGDAGRPNGNGHRPPVLRL